MELDETEHGLVAKLDSYTINMLMDKRLQKHERTGSMRLPSTLSWSVTHPA